MGRSPLHDHRCRGRDYHARRGPGSGIGDRVHGRFREGSRHPLHRHRPHHHRLWRDGSIVVYLKYAYDDTQEFAEATTNQPIALDAFTRADGSTLGTPTVGPAWTVQAGVWGIASNQGRLVTATTLNDSVVIDAGRADVTVQVKIAAVTGSPGLGIRASDNANSFTTNTFALHRRAAGVNTQLAAFSETLVAGDTLRIVAKGTTLTCYRQAASTGAFVQIATADDAQNLTVTTHGIRSSGDAAGASRFDDFRIEAA